MLRTLGRRKSQRRSGWRKGATKPLLAASTCRGMSQPVRALSAESASSSSATGSEWPGWVEPGVGAPPMGCSWPGAVGSPTPVGAALRGQGTGGGPHSEDARNLPPAPREVAPHPRVGPPPPLPLPPPLAPPPLHGQAREVDGLRRAHRGGPRALVLARGA